MTYAVVGYPGQPDGAGSGSPVGTPVAAGLSDASHGPCQRPTDGSAVCQAATLEHVVQFYETDAHLLGAVEEYISTALRAGDAGVVIATAAHREALDDRFQASGLDVAAARACGRYVSLDAAETLAPIMVDGTPEPGRFERVVGDTITRAAEGGRRVRVFGEMVALLSVAGQHAAAFRLEALWTGLQQLQSFALLCAYPIDGLGEEVLTDVVGIVSGMHTHVIPTESFMALPSEDDRLRAVAILQQKARRLEAEVTERERAEARLRFLAQAGQLLASSLDYETTLRMVTVLAVPELADWCAVHLVDERGDIRQLAVAHVDPARVVWAQELADRYPVAPDAAAGPAKVVRTGEPELIPDIHDEMLVAAARDAEHLHLLRSVGPRSSLCVPLLARDHVLGTVTFLTDESGRRYATADLAWAKSLASRAGLAINNARLYGEAREEAAIHAALNAALRETAEARDQALADVEAALRVRDEFLASVSHDLRTPLSTIKGLVQLVLRQAGRDPTLDSARVSQLLNNVDAATTKMGAIIDELLDVSRLEAGRPLDLNRQPTDLVALVRQLAADYQREISACRLVVKAEVPVLAGSWDPVRLERVVSNLVSNAIKYSPDGGSVTLALAREDVGGAAWATLMVEDHGMGIPAADLPHVFERFHRGANVAGQIQGVGIGLASCKQIVQQHGGTIAVASDEGVGTTVTLRLPCEQPGDPAAPDEADGEDA